MLLPRLFIKAFGLMLGLLVGLSLTACQQDPAEALLMDYVERVSTVLEVPLDVTEPPVMLPAWPERRQRLLAVTDLREGLLEVWDFQQCGMMSLIAERNSSLGKVMPPSRVLQYELRFLAALQRCIHTLQTPSAVKKEKKQSTTETTFLKRLKQIHTIKQQNLPKILWNSIYTSEEISGHFALGKSPLPLDNNYHEPVQQALQQLATLVPLTQADQSAQTSALSLPEWLNSVEEVYYAFYSSELGARLLPSIRLLTHYLNQTAEHIETRLAKKPFCYPNHQPRRADYLLNVFTQYYVGKVQPYMAMIQREGQRWLQHHDQIMQKLPLPEGMQAYHQQVISMTHEKSLWQQWQAASKRHTKAWQTILGQCNRMPG